jgi:metallo-beta-lactamase class B
MEIADGTRPVHVVFFSSASINAGTRLTGPNAAYPEIATDLERTFQKLKALPCDIFFAPHGGQFAMAEKFARLDRGENPITALQDAAGWKSLIAKMESDFHATLAAEKSEAAP